MTEQLSKQEIGFYLQKATQMALKAGSELEKGFKEASYQVKSKSGKHNLVTEYDERVERMIRSEIESLFPSHSILGEEEGLDNKSADLYWIIDPLDGTVNFAHRLPAFCTSIALATEHESLVGVVYAPITHELFFAAKGQGAFLNGKPITVTHNQHLQDCILATGFPYDISDHPHPFVDQLASMVAKGIPLRRCGSAAIDLCYVADGRFDAFWEISLNPWDFAAGHLIVEEAKGKCTTMEKEPINFLKTSSYMATNGLIHDEFAHQLANNSEY